MWRWVISLNVIFLACAVGCTNIDVKTDFDPTVDFSRFKTFAFAGFTDLNQSGVLNNTLTRRRLETVISGELVKKGLRQVGIDENPDVLVHYWMGVKEKQTLESTGPSVGAYRGYGGYGWGAGYSGVTTREYKEGTLITDLIEPTKKDLVWRATMVANLKDSTEGNIELGNAALKKAFENYPPSQAK
jgi:hypothetical protein